MFGIYVHIPYCLQRCHYCDFATYEWKKILPPEEYTSLIKQEVRQRKHLIPHKTIDSIYFGGGTPSLISAELIVSIIEELNNNGFQLNETCEITIEINPATIDKLKMQTYFSAGINRFSVGAQSFNDNLLKLCGRKHSAEDTRQTLNLLKEYNCNYSFDLLFALPKQSLQDLRLDLEEIGQFQPPHLSTYYLTVPQGHMMSVNRPIETEALKMFDLIDEKLSEHKLHKYEISNFAREGFESIHNQLYWYHHAYWGLGLSSHSYLPKQNKNGLRFWNPKSINDYKDIISSEALKPLDGFEALPKTQFESLKLLEKLTDYCHTYLRTRSGLPKNLIKAEFSEPLFNQLGDKITPLISNKLIVDKGSHWALSTEGERLSNKVFYELCFS